MKLPFALVRRRTVRLPTLWGWLLLLVLAATALAAAGRALYPFLAVHDPSGAQILVIEGWMDAEGLDQALAAFRSGGYERAVVTGGPLEPWPRNVGFASYAERAADYLKAEGMPASGITVVSSAASMHDRTFLSAVTVREWAKASGLEIRAIDVFSEAAHARRSRLLYEMAFGPQVKVGVLAAHSQDVGEDWWRSAYGTRHVLDQAIAYAWTRLFFRPPPGQRPE